MKLRLAGDILTAILIAAVLFTAVSGLFRGGF